jgi:sugar-phosphatase
MSHRFTRNKPLTDDAAVFRKTYAAFLFDMDGTLLSSIAAAERVWGAWARRHGLDVDTFLPTIHGVRAEDTIRRQNLAGIDVDAEVEWVHQGELDDVEGVVAIDGIVDFLNALPGDRWAIVTSGKPEPDCFLLAAERLGVKASDCLVFEDAPAGIAAGEAAGADVMVITATHGEQHYETKHAKTRSYRSVVVSIGDDGQLSVERRGHGE